MKGFFTEQKRGGEGGGWRESPPSQVMLTGMVTGSAAHAGRSRPAHAANLGLSSTQGTLQALQTLLAAQPKFPTKFTTFGEIVWPWEIRVCHRPVYSWSFTKQMQLRGASLSSPR